MSKGKTAWKLMLPMLAVLGVLVLSATGADAQIVSNHTFPVNVTNDSPWFQPTRISVVVGDTVTWTNRSQGTHTITSLQMANTQETELDTSDRDGGLVIGGAFDRRAFMPGETFSVTFNGPATFPYVCFIHPYMG